MANYGKSLPNKWTKMFKRLQTYQQEHDGSCNVPQGYPQDPKLGRWVKKQRNIYKKGSLAKERCDLLEKIGFGWTDKSREQSFQDQWVEMFKRLQAYQQEHDGTCNVPRKYPQDPKLGRWVNMQRNLYKKGSLAKERYDQLEAIGFEWTRNRGQQPMHDQWNSMLIRLQAYQQEHNGSCNVPQRYHQDPELGRWVKNQRYRYKKDRLTKERCDQLEAIGFVWTGLKLTDKEGFRAKERCDQLEEIGFQRKMKNKSTSRKPEPLLSAVSKTKQPGTEEPLRWCWV